MVVNFVINQSPTYVGELQCYLNHQASLLELLLKLKVFLFSGLYKDNVEKEASEANKSLGGTKDTPEHGKDILQHVTDNNDQSIKDGVMEQHIVANNEDDTGEINMEAAIKADDVLRAGGYGARDDIGSFLPVAIDSTDFEASLRDARDFEEPQGETSRPGLGWQESMDDSSYRH